MRLTRIEHDDQHLTVCVFIQLVSKSILYSTCTDFLLKCNTSNNTQ